MGLVETVVKDGIAATRTLSVTNERLRARRGRDWATGRFRFGALVGASISERTATLNAARRPHRARACELASGVR